MTGQIDDWTHAAAQTALYQINAAAMHINARCHAHENFIQTNAQYTNSRQTVRQTDFIQNLFHQFGNMIGFALLCLSHFNAQLTYSRAIQHG